MQPELWEILVVVVVFFDAGQSSSAMRPVCVQSPHPLTAGLSRVPFLPGEEEHPLQQREGGSGPGRRAWREPWQVSAEFR